MKDRVWLLLTLILDVFWNNSFISFFSNAWDKIPVSPELSFPKNISHLWSPLEYFPCCDAFDNPGYLRRRIHWYWLDQKVNMIFVCSNLKKINAVSFWNIQTYPFDFFINLFRKYHLSLFCWAHQVIQEYGHIMAFVQIDTHPEIVALKDCRGKPRGTTLRMYP